MPTVQFAGLGCCKCVTKLVLKPFDTLTSFRVVIGLNFPEDDFLIRLFSLELLPVHHPGCVNRLPQDVMTLDHLEPEQKQQLLYTTFSSSENNLDNKHKVCPFSQLLSVQVTSWKGVLRFAGHME